MNTAETLALANSILASAENNSRELDRAAALFESAAKRAERDGDDEAAESAWKGLDACAFLAGPILR